MSRMLVGPRSGRGLVILFLVVTILPALALVALGVRLLEQERVLAKQRRRESLDRAAGHAVLVLEQELALLRRQLAAGEWDSRKLPGDSATLAIRGESVHASPPGRLPYLPATAALKEIPESPFTETESIEFARQDLPEALRRYASLAGAQDPGLRAGALLRQARVLRKLGRGQDALAANDRLAGIHGVGFGGMPADLQARRNRCAILAGLQRTEELATEAGRVRDDLLAGRWTLDRATFEHFAGQLGGWLGSTVTPRQEQAALAEAAAWLHRRWTASLPGEFPAEGAHAFSTVLVVWHFSGEGVNALLAGPAFVERHLFDKAAAAVHPVRVEARIEKPAGGIRVQRSAAESGLPWPVAVELDPSEPLQDAARSRLLQVGFVLLLLLSTAGSYLIWRAVSRELAVARLQSDFVAAVSHEFRTPLTTLAHLNDLLAGGSEPLSEKRRAYYQAQARATSRLRRLVETLLDFGRMEAGRQPYRFEPLDAGAFARDVCEAFGVEVADRGFTMEFHACDEDLPVLADADALERALWNLLDNAVKYSGESRRIALEASSRDSRVRIEVVDFGLGIGPEDQLRIFEKFTRGDAAREHGIKGTGIGLAMVRHIAHAHGGEVTVSSTKGRGSAFTIVLPRRR